MCNVSQGVFYYGKSGKTTRGGSAWVGLTEQGVSRQVVGGVIGNKKQRINIAEAQECETPRRVRGHSER